MRVSIATAMAMTLGGAHACLKVTYAYDGGPAGVTTNVFTLLDDGVETCKGPCTPHGCSLPCNDGYSAKISSGARGAMFGDLQYSTPHGDYGLTTLADIKMPCCITEPNNVCNAVCIIADYCETFFPSGCTRGGGGC